MARNVRGFSNFSNYGEAPSYKHPRYKGFILKAEYPGCRKRKGDFEPFTNGTFLKYPDVWEPVLHDDVARDEKLNQLGIQ